MSGYFIIIYICLQYTYSHFSIMTTVAAWLIGSASLFTSMCRCTDNGLSVDNIVLWDNDACKSSSTPSSGSTSALFKSRGDEMYSIRSWERDGFFRETFRMDWPHGHGTIADLGRHVVWSNSSNTCILSKDRSTISCRVSPVESALVFAEKEMVCYLFLRGRKHPCFTLPSLVLK